VSAEAEALPPEDAPRWPVTVKLSQPIETDKTLIESLTFREIKAGMLRGTKIRLNIETTEATESVEIALDFGDLLDVLARSAVVPNAVISRLALTDLAAITRRVFGFFSQSHRIGSGSSGISSLPED
jgi:hypothetical protein